MDNFLAPARVTAFQRPLLIGGLFVLTVSLLGVMLSPGAFFHAYLFAYMFWLGIALGCLAVMMLQHLSGGAWGLMIRRVLEAASRTFPLLLVLFLPLLFGLTTLYPWTRASLVATDEVLQSKRPYLNVPFFLIRAAIYFAVWWTIARLVNRWSAERDRTGSQLVARRLQFLSAGGLVLYGITVTFAAIDWVMSLEPHWFSTIFGVIVMGGQGLSAFAFSIVVIVWLATDKPLAGVVTQAHLHDLGNLMLAFVMLWAYFSFSQYLIIWTGNLPEEIPWHLHRLSSGWRAVAVVLIVFHFCVPFVLLLSRRTKRHARPVAAVAIGLIVMRLVDLFWMIGPESHTAGFDVHWLDVTLPVGLGGVWLAMFVRELARYPVLPVGDPLLAEVLAEGRER